MYKSSTEKRAQIADMMINGAKEEFVATLIQEIHDELDGIVLPDKSTMLHIAVKMGRNCTVKQLVMNGIKVDSQDIEGNTALHYAQ